MSVNYKELFKQFAKRVSGHLLNMNSSELTGMYIYMCEQFFMHVVINIQ